VREIPQTELTPFYPRSPYGVAKAYGHSSRSTTARATTARDQRHLFNHESPRRGLEFVTRKITWHAAAIKLGSPRSCTSATSTPSATGVREGYVEAMWLMLQRDEPEDFVISTGVTNSVRDCVSSLRPGRLDIDAHVVIDRSSSAGEVDH